MKKIENVILSGLREKAFMFAQAIGGYCIVLKDKEGWRTTNGLWLSHRSLHEWRSESQIIRGGYENCNGAVDFDATVKEALWFFSDDKENLLYQRLLQVEKPEETLFLEVEVEGFIENEKYKKEITALKKAMLKKIQDQNTYNRMYTCFLEKIKNTDYSKGAKLFAFYNTEKNQFTFSEEKIEKSIPFEYFKEYHYTALEFTMKRFENQFVS